MSFELGGNAPFIGVAPQSFVSPALLTCSLRRRGSRRSSNRSDREQIQTQRSDLRLRQPYLRAVSHREHSHPKAHLTARRSTKSSRPSLSRRFPRSKSETGWSLGCERRAQMRKPGTDTRTHGPLIHARAADKVESHIKDAVAKGAKLLIGGGRGEGSFFQPTVLSGITPDARVLQEETFGPLAALVEFESVYAHPRRETALQQGRGKRSEWITGSQSDWLSRIPCSSIRDHPSWTALVEWW